MGTTPENTGTPTTVSSQMSSDPHSSMADYPRLETDPNGRSTARPARPDPNADLKPPALNYDTVEHIGPSMTVVKDGSPPLPLHGGTPLGQGGTNSSVAEQMQRRLQNDLDLREAIEADGQTVEDFDITRGTHSGRGVNEPPADKTSDQLKDDLMRMGGASEADIRHDRLHRR